MHNNGEVGDDIVLKDREQISLCLKENDSLSVHLRQKKITERSLKIKVNFLLFIVFIYTEIKILFQN